MTRSIDPDAAAEEYPRRLFIYNAGFLRQPRLRSILRAAGWSLRLGMPGPNDHVAVWGRSPTAHRGEAIAARRGAGLIRIEDAFLRSIHPGPRSGPLGLLIDPIGVHFDSASPSLPERILQLSPLDDAAILQRARDGMARLRALELSKYNNFDPGLPAPPPGYVLVVDQTRGDASIRHGGASAATFREMLAYARIEHPQARIIIKAHPDHSCPGHFTQAECDDRTTLLTEPVSPWQLLDGAIAVYTVSSQLGLEAIFAGHKPRVFGQPFYAGWGLTTDENPVPRRTRRITRTQLFAVSHILAPTWFDPCRQRLCSFEEAIDQLEAEVRAWREDRQGHVALGMRLWKRGTIQRFFGRERPVRFARKAPTNATSVLVWAGHTFEAAGPVRQVEDGFLRSRGLGAELVPPLSLVADRTGIHYDPSRPSDLETLIAAPPPPGAQQRTERLLQRIRAAELSKYNLSLPAPQLPAGHRILVPGQVENDASLRHGAGQICTNLALLSEVRARNRQAVLLFKPHPDVEAGLRPGAVPEAETLRLADAVLHNSNPITLIDACDEVWTMTSLLGFEALLRGKKVTCTGAPFYAGWGLTRDLGPVPERRTARPPLWQLAHAALIAYPRYLDPVSGLPCPPEVIIERLSDPRPTRSGAGLRWLGKLQGQFASLAWLWR